MLSFPSFHFVHSYFTARKYFVLLRQELVEALDELLVAAEEHQDYFDDSFCIDVSLFIITHCPKESVVHFFVVFVLFFYNIQIPHCVLYLHLCIVSDVRHKHCRRMLPRRVHLRGMHLLMLHMLITLWLVLHVLLWPMSLLMH